MYKFTETQLEFTPYYLEHLPKHLSFSISGTSYYPNPEKTGPCKYDNTCACYYNEFILFGIDYGDEPCPDCKNLLKSKPIVFKNGMLLYMNNKTLCYTNLPMGLYSGQGDYLWITQNNIGETVRLRIMKDIA